MKTFFVIKQHNADDRTSFLSQYIAANYEWTYNLRYAHKFPNENGVYEKVVTFIKALPSGLYQIEKVFENV